MVIVLAVRIRFTNTDLMDLARGCRALAEQARRDAQAQAKTSAGAMCLEIARLFDQRVTKLERMARNGKSFVLVVDDEPPRRAAAKAPKLRLVGGA